MADSSVEKIGQEVTEQGKKDLKDLFNDASKDFGEYQGLLDGIIKNFKNYIKEKENNQSQSSWLAPYKSIFQATKPLNSDGEQMPVGEFLDKILPQRSQIDGTKVIELIGHDLDLEHQSQEQQANEGKFKQDFINAYATIEKILARMKILPNFTFMIIIEDKEHYLRYEVEADKLNPEWFDPSYISDKDSFMLKLQKPKLKPILENEFKNKEIEKLAKDMKQHYLSFIEPYKTYQKRATTGWKMSRGIASQAYERHLERMHHGESFGTWKNLNNSTPDHLESVGRRWFLYKQSSNSDAFYTGPDTAHFQVKADNANLTANLNSIVDAVVFLKDLLNTNRLEKVSEDSLRSIFNQKKVKDTINWSITQALAYEGDQAVADFEDEMRKQLGKDLKNITIEPTKREKEKYNLTKKVKIPTGTTNFSEIWQQYLLQVFEA